MNRFSLVLTRYHQFIKFGFVGLSNTAIGFGTYWVMVYFGIHYQVANIVSFVISSLNGYILNRVWVFEANDTKIVGQLSKYYIVYGSSLLISMLLSYVWIELVGMNKYLPPVLNLFVTIPYNYLFNKIWAFRKGSILKDKNAMRMVTGEQMRIDSE